MNLELDLTWRLPLGRRWAYVARRRETRDGGITVPWWVVMLLVGPVTAALALALALGVLWMQGR
jgi:hypothetical protein